MPLVVVYYERWSGPVAKYLGWNASVQSTPIIADKPRSEWQYRGPYRFKEFPRQPRLGWQLFPNQQQNNLTLPGQDWKATLQWKGWSRQPWQGFTTPTDQPVTVIGSANAIQVQAYFSPWSAKGAFLGWQQAPGDQDTSLKTPGQDWRATRQWKSWSPALQAYQGWQQESDTTVTPNPPWSPVRQWKRWSPALQAFQGWQQESDVTAEIGPSWKPVKQFSGWGRQPWLGQVQASDSVQTFAQIQQNIAQWTRWKAQPWIGWQPAHDARVVVTEGIAPSQLLRPYLFKEFRRQAQLGFGSIESTSPVGATIFTITRRHRWHREHATRDRRLN